MSETKDLFALLRQSADGGVVDAIERLVAEGKDHQLCRINPLAFAARNGLDEEDDDRGLPACDPHRHVRHRLERALPGLRRRARHQLDAEDRPEGRICLLALRRSPIHRRSTRWSTSPSPSVRGSAGSPRTMPTNCRCRNISARCTGVPASTCRRRATRRSSTISSSTMWSLRRAKRAYCRSSFLPSSSSSSSRSPIRRSSSTSRASRRASARACR